MPPFTVIGGYLGAGKTTLLNNLLNQANGLRAAVLVNDFGDVNIDVALIASHEGDTISLANGCMCCSLTGGFASAIHAILQRGETIDHIFIEASGVAEPGKVAQYGQMFELQLDGVLVVVDAELIRTQATNKYVGETVLRQLAQADMLLLNKSDLVLPDDSVSLREWLGERAPRAPVYETAFSRVPFHVLIGRRAATVRLSRFAADNPDHEGQHETWTLTRSAPVPRAMIERLAEQLSAKVFRAKGFVQIAEAPSRRHLLQLVGRRWTLEDVGPWDGAASATQVVCIGPPGTSAAYGRFDGFALSQ